MIRNEIDDLRSNRQTYESNLSPVLPLVSSGSSSYIDQFRLSDLVLTGSLGNLNVVGQPSDGWLSLKTLFGLFNVFSKYSLSNLQQHALDR